MAKCAYATERYDHRAAFAAVRFAFAPLYSFFRWIIGLPRCFMGLFTSADFFSIPICEKRTPPASDSTAASQAPKKAQGAFSPLLLMKKREDLPVNGAVGGPPALAGGIAAGAFVHRGFGGCGFAAAAGNLGHGGGAAAAAAASACEQGQKQQHGKHRGQCFFIRISPF